MMVVVEAVVASAAQAACGSLVLSHAGRTVDLTPPWRRLSMIDALRDYAGLDWADLTDDDAAARIARERELKLDRKPTVATVMKKLVDELVEPNLVDPTHLVDHPVIMSPLAKRDPERPELTQRFESFVSGVELANAFSELNDPLDQRGRFEQQSAEKAAGDDEAHPMDEDFLEALEPGMPPTGGLGIGRARRVMLLTDTRSIRDVILFPLMKPEE